MFDDRPTEPSPLADPAPADVVESRRQRWRPRLAEVHPALWCVLLLWLTFSVLFGSLAVSNHRNFGTWSFDLGIYDQGIWLLSRGKQFITVRGINMWGHHINLVTLLLAPFYWFGAGPQFLVAVQAAWLGFGAIPVYLIARDRFGRPWMGALFATLFLMYAPIQWLSSANFHPEALVITPLLFAWWLGRQRRWTGCLIWLALALSTREDVALAVFVFGLALWWLQRSEGEVHRNDRRVALGIAAYGVVYYLAVTKFIIPAFNQGREPFYVKGFYAGYGDSMFDVAGNVLRHPNWVISDGTQPDRIRFYRDLLLPWGGLPLTAPLELAMAGPQMLASVIGSSPYARMIKYQYTSVMLAPITIAAIEGSARLWHRFAAIRRPLVVWLVLCAYVTNVAWSPSPLGTGFNTWAGPNERHVAMRAAVASVPDDAAVTATYQLLPHLAHRTHIYDWPNPWVESYWGNDDGYRLPDPSLIDYLVLDLRVLDEDKRAMVSELTAPGGEFEVVSLVDEILVARRP